MQFKHPEILWGLLLLLIPIFIHLFQLRRFKKTPFTNVKFLKKVTSESRRSSTLKKWLLLFTRMLILATLVIAFAQPFFSKKSALQQKELVVYLDDSFSMQAKTDNSSLLEEAVQNLIKNIPANEKFSLFTNKRVFKDRSIKSIQNDLLTLSSTNKQLDLNEIYLKAKPLFKSDQSTIKNLVVVSDFQERLSAITADSSSTITKHLVQKVIKNIKNVSIDSVFFNSSVSDNIELTATLSTNNEIESIPVSLFNAEKLIAKTAATFDKNKKSTVHFTLPKRTPIDGKIEISDNSIAYDNVLYFNTNAKEKVKVLAIGDTDSNYLKRIFNSDDFIFNQYALKSLNYSDLNDQHLILLNELETIPNALITNLKTILKNDGSLVIIPASKIDTKTYNQLTKSINSTRFTTLVKDTHKITDIAFSHPLYHSVFEKKVTNFQYPRVSQYYRIKTNAPNILSFQDKAPFLIGTNAIYIFTASLSGENSNFKSSPLIVPTFYNMAMNSLKQSKLYHSLDIKSEVDIPLVLEKDNIIKVASDKLEFIPQQQSFANKVRLFFSKNATIAGVFKVTVKDSIYKKISFNYSREESQLRYLNIDDLNASTKNQSIQPLFHKMQNDNAIDALWKWFIILATIFMIIEVLIQKYM